MRFRPGRALILFACALVLGLAARGDGPAVFLSREAWSADDPAFGGWSGLEVSDDGSAFTAVSDRGWIAEGRLRRGAGGGLRAVEAGPMRRLDDTADGFFERDMRDAEGLALAPDGRMFIAFEGVRRVLLYPDTGGTGPVVLPIYRDFIGLAENRSLEALAIGADGTLYTLPEAFFGTGPRPVYRFDEDGWRVFSRLPDPGDGFAPVGADIGPDGRFYLLERKVLRRVGFASRVRRFDLAADGLAGETLVLRTRAGTHDNLEGLAVWRDEAGRLRLTMVSDDNLGPWQKTELVEYALAE